MAINKPMEMTFRDIKHIVIDIVLVECHCVLLHIWVISQIQITLGDFRVWCARKKSFCRCEYRGDTSAAFCLFGP